MKNTVKSLKVGLLVLAFAAYAAAASAAMAAQSSKNGRSVKDILAQCELASGQLTAETGVWPAEAQEAAFRAFCQRSYQATRHLVEQASEQQAKRSRRHKGGDAE